MLCHIEDEVRQPASKKPKSCDTNISENFEVLNKKLDEIGKKLSVIDSVVEIGKKILECVICKSVVKFPVVSKCCQRIIGCRAYVMTWRGTSTRCPLCSVSGRINDVLELKGFNDVTSLLRTGDDDTEPQVAGY